MSHLPFEEWSDQITRSVQTLNEDVHALKVNSATDKQVDALIQLQEKQMNHQASYTNLIMVAGYAGFRILVNAGNQITAMDFRAMRSVDDSLANFVHCLGNH